jgi:hypothetical protein
MNTDPSTRDTIITRVGEDTVDKAEARAMTDLLYINVWNATSGDLAPFTSGHKDEESAIEEIVDGMLNSAYSETIVVTYGDWPPATQAIDLGQAADRESLARRREKQAEWAMVCSWE